MLKKQADKWVKALVSGEFEQGRGALCRTGSDGNTYCCLGVASKIFGTEKPEGAYLSTSEMEETGLSTNNGRPQTGKVTVRKGNRRITVKNLAEANDKGASFQSIATWIKKNYKLL